MDGHSKLKGNLFKCKYENQQKTFDGVVRVIEKFQSLQVHLIMFKYIPYSVRIEGNHSSGELVCLKGEIPIFYNDCKYGIFVKIFLPKSHPLKPPMCFVVPTRGVKLKKHIHVSPKGRVHLTYLYNWDCKKCSLLGLVKKMSTVFGQYPPIVLSKRSKSLNNEGKFDRGNQRNDDGGYYDQVHRKDYTEIVPKKKLKRKMKEKKRMKRDRKIEKKENEALTKDELISKQKDQIHRLTVKLGLFKEEIKELSLVMSKLSNEKSVIEEKFDLETLKISTEMLRITKEKLEVEERLKHVTEILYKKESLTFSDVNLHGIKDIKRFQEIKTRNQDLMKKIQEQNERIDERIRTLFEETKEEKICTICMERTKDTSHVFCFACATYFHVDMNQCPLDKKKIEKLQKIFL